MARTRQSKTDVAKLLKTHEISRLSNETLMSVEEISRWIVSVKGVLVEWKKRCIDNSTMRTSMLEYAGENRQVWDKKAGNIAARCTTQIADSDIDSLDAIDLCAHTACMVVMHGEVNAYFTDSSRDDAWRNKCAVRLLLAIIADFLDHSDGYFVGPLGAPKPSMHQAGSFDDDDDDDEEVEVPRKKRKVSSKKASTVVPQPPQTKHLENEYDDGWDSDHIPATGPIPERYQRRDPVEPTLAEQLRTSQNQFRREREDRRVDNIRLEALASKWEKRAKEGNDSMSRLINNSVRREYFIVKEVARQETSRLHKRVEKEVERCNSATALAAKETARADEEAAAREEAEAKLEKAEKELAELKMATKYSAPLGHWA